jgi:signal transduction histidine kinase
LFSCFLTAREAVARTDLLSANRELKATRELLANTSRLAERERISRDLHDTLGHHLTALSLNLEAASHVSSGSALTQVQRAQAVTKLLLSDVRGTVGALRGEDAMSLAEALATLVDAVAEPQVHLRVSNDLMIYDPLCAQTALRCVQEIVTNAIRHAHAANLWIELTSAEGHLRLVAHDDGRGVEQVTAGHGLRGMRERVELIGGELDIRSAPAQGFRISASLPLRGGAT